MSGDSRRVGERGQVTIPKDIREQFDISGGDEVVIRQADGHIVVEPPASRERLAEGYRERADRDRTITAELGAVSEEADEGLGDAPEW